MRCELCDGRDEVTTYRCYPASSWHGGSPAWVLDHAHSKATNYCNACVEAARKRNVRHAAMVFFLPTVGLMRLWKFSRCSREEMGDLMAASAWQGRDPARKHILWPYGRIESVLTREGAEKLLRKRGKALAAH